MKETFSHFDQPQKFVAFNFENSYPLPYSHNIGYQCLFHPIMDYDGSYEASGHQNLTDKDEPYLAYESLSDFGHVLRLQVKILHSFWSGAGRIENQLPLHHLVEALYEHAD